VLLGEDIVSTGLSARECLEAIAEEPGEVIAAACIINRSGGKADLGVPLVALADADFPAYAPDALPPELEGIPAVKPGSRHLSQ